MPSLPTARFAAIRYLHFWFDHDLPNTTSLQTGTREEQLAALRKIASEYKIARTLPKSADEDRRLKRFEPVLDALLDVRDGATMTETVQGFRLALSAYDSPLSAASKFLWHYRHHRPVNGDHVCIYDRRAFDGVCAGKEIERGKYEKFVAAWKCEYELRKEEIAAACADLNKLSGFLRYEALASENDLAVLTSKDWFRERVFDFMLWLAK